jgi:hypothetical protein
MSDLQFDHIASSLSGEGFRAAAYGLSTFKTLHLLGYWETCICYPELRAVRSLTCTMPSTVKQTRPLPLPPSGRTGQPVGGLAENRPNANQSGPGRTRLGLATAKGSIDAAVEVFA